MSEENIRKHLRAAVSEIVAAEKSNLQRFYGDRNNYRADSIKMMEPVITALKALKDELGDGVEIEVLEATETYHTTALFPDQKITVKLSSELFPMYISTNGKLSYLFNDCLNPEFECRSIEDVLRPILNAIGKRIAMNQVINERKN